MFNKIFIFILSGLFTSLLYAADYEVQISNHIGAAIYELYISPAGTDDWEEDILDQAEIIEDGEDYVVSLTDYDSAIFDIKAVDETGNAYAVYEVDTANEDVILTQDSLEN